MQFGGYLMTPPNPGQLRLSSRPAQAQKSRCFIYLIAAQGHIRNDLKSLRPLVRCKPLLLEITYHLIEGVRVPGSEQNTGADPLFHDRVRQTNDRGLDNCWMAQKELFKLRRDYRLGASPDDLFFSPHHHEVAE